MGKAARAERDDRRASAGRPGLIEALVDAAPDAILVVDGAGRIVLANAAAERLFGYAQHELVGAPVDALLPERHREAHGRHRAGYAATPRTRPMGGGLELSARRRDGGEVPVEISLSPLATGPPTGSTGSTGSSEALVTVFLRDVRERRAVQARLRQREIQLAAELATHAAAARLAAVVDASDDAIVGKTPDGTVTAWNRGAERLYGYAAHEMVGHHVDRLAPPERIDEVAGILARLLVGEGVSRLDTVRRRKDGTLVNVALVVSPIRDAGGRVTGAAAVSRDISERLRVLEAERRTAGLLRRLLALATEAALALTPADVAAVALRQGIAALGADAGHVVVLTPDGAWLEMLCASGYADDAAEPWRHFPLATPVAIADAVRTAAPIWLGSPDAYAAQYPHRADVGRALPHSAHAALPLLVQGQAIGALGLSFAAPQPFAESDRTFLLALAQVCANNLARARLYEDERAAHAAAEEARQQRDVFIAVAAHELRSPLTTIRGYAQLGQRLLRTGQTGEADATLQRAALDAIEQQSGRLALLVGDLLDLGRIQSGTLALDPGEADLRALADGAVAAAQSRTTAHAIVVRGPGALGAQLDSLRIEQVLTNLLDNAIAYSPGGEIAVELAQVDGETLRIAVRDHGQGIPAERLPHIFEPFYRADERRGGSDGGVGLGLYICREIVVRHGGRIEATCPDDGGTRITVTLPAGVAPT